LLILSARVKRPDSRLDLRDRPRKVGQLTSDKGYVLLGCHRLESMVAGAKVSRACNVRRCSFKLSHYLAPR
jgi:hypothetical protein